MVGVQGLEMTVGVQGLESRAWTLNGRELETKLGMKMIQGQEKMEEMTRKIEQQNVYPVVVLVKLQFASVLCSYPLVIQVMKILQEENSEADSLE